METNYEERDIFLTKAMGECWHEGRAYRGYVVPIDCEVCGKEWYEGENNDFSTGDGFFKLLKWAKKKSIYRNLVEIINEEGFDFIEPDIFANTVYDMLRSSDKRYVKCECLIQNELRGITKPTWAGCPNCGGEGFYYL